MPDQLPLHKIVALAIGALPLTSAVACPYMSSSHDPSTRHESILDKRAADASGACPRRPNVAGGGTRSRDFWPCQLRLDVLRQNSPESNPLTAGFDYAAEFSKLDVDQLKKDMTALQTTSQSWWPADYGDYGPFFVRLAWHSAGTYRQMDGRGGSGMGQQRFAPLNGWADNANLDKARRLLWPIKQKYGSALSWADLFVFAGNTALENMGLPTHGFAFGRVDTWQADGSVYWGDETDMFPSPESDLERYDGSTDIDARSSDLDGSLANTNMGLIYVDPRGPHGIPDPEASARDIRTTFGRMGMDDEETVALIAGGHAFGKTHGAVDGDSVGPDPNAADIALQGLGWHNDFNTGFANNTFTSGLEVVWSSTPTKWSNHFFESLFQNNFTLVTSPGGAPQWEAQSAEAVIPDPFSNHSRKPTMMTSDLGLINDPVFLNISHTYWKDFGYFTTKFSESWFKLLHRDMGPLSRYLGPYVPTTPPFLWQDPLPAAPSHTITTDHVATLKSSILSAPGLNISNLITTAWGSASSFRISDKRGGANGARIALAPQSSWTCNNPPRLSAVLSALRQVRASFNAANPSTPVSLADLIVIGGNAAIESAAVLAGHPAFTVPFSPGRVDASQEDTDPTSFAFLEGRADGFRNCGVGTPRGLTEELLVDKAALLALSPPELTVLVGGMRALDANFDGSSYGVLTSRPGRLTNDFFVNLLDMSTIWKPVADTNEEEFVGKDFDTGSTKYTAKRADLIFGSHPELRAIAEVYAQDDAGDKFVKDFVAAWVKVSELDRFDLRK